MNERAAKLQPIMPVNGMSNGLGSTLLESLCCVAIPTIVERRFPPLEVEVLVPVATSALMKALPVGVGWPSCETVLSIIT